MSKKFSLYGVFAAIFALCLMVASPALAHHDPEHEQGGGSEQTASENGSENTPGNDRKEGYEDNSSEPQEPNHGKGSDHDGDADSDSGTAQEDGHETTNDSPNAHPSGNDKDGEAGGSGNQGNAESDPDDDGRGPDRSNGGPDKPGGSGGTDLDDQDGNNGCGNDDDFEDDNEGLCGGPDRTKPKAITKTCPDGSQMPANGQCEEVAGGVITHPGQPTCPDGSIMSAGGNCGENVPCPEGTVMDASGNCLEVNPSIPEQVLGEEISKDKARPDGPSVLGVKLSPALNEPVEVAGAVLPFTGGDMLVFLVLALALFASGVLIMRSSASKASDES